jgi:hypothetical protein
MSRKQRRLKNCGVAIPLKANAMALPAIVLAADAWQLAASKDQPTRFEVCTRKGMDAN